MTCAVVQNTNSSHSMVPVSISGQDQGSIFQLLPGFLAANDDMDPGPRCQIPSLRAGHPISPGLQIFPGFVWPFLAQKTRARRAYWQIHPGTLPQRIQLRPLSFAKTMWKDLSFQGIPSIQFDFLQVPGIQTDCKFIDLAAIPVSWSCVRVSSRTRFAGGLHHYLIRSPSGPAFPGWITEPDV